MYPFPFGVGVCGIAAQTMTTQCIDDVHQFEGHIACDASSNSEIVIPVQLKGDTIAVLEIDSTGFGRFDREDQIGLESIVQIFEKSLIASEQALEKNQFI